MFTNVLRQIKTAILLLIFFTILTGVIYPVIVTGIAQLLFPWYANGSLLKRNNEIIGSHFIGQSFSGPNYFWGRPSATTPFAYNAANSSGSNLGPFNLNFISVVMAKISNLHQADPDNHNLIPIDLVTASGSGLDPDISPLAAFYQVHRIAKARGLAETQVKKLVQESIQYRTFGIFGEPRVNVVELNMALDKKLM